MISALRGLVFALCLLVIGAPVHAQCYGPLALSSAYFEFDYLARIAVHFGDASDVPEDIMCSRSMLPGEETIDVPLWAYNLHEGIEYVEFSVVSNESLAVFVPDNCFTVVASCRCRSGDAYRLDLALQACGSTCGPVRLGHARVVRVAGSDPVWIDLEPNSQTGKMFVMDAAGASHSMFSPQHGGFVGVNYLYSCQAPICEEPNTPVTAFTASKGSGCSVKLEWIAGSGNRTMIRYRSDRYPSGYEDGDLAVEVPTSPGESRFFFHTGMPNPATLYYKAFSLTRDASDLVIRDSFVECASADTAAVNCIIATGESSWGAIKSLFR